MKKKIFFSLEQLIKTPRKIQANQSTKKKKNKLRYFHFFDPIALFFPHSIARKNKNKNNFFHIHKIRGEQQNFPTFLTIHSISIHITTIQITGI